jgi:ApaG protein
MVSKITNGVNVKVNVSFIKKIIKDTIGIHLFEYDIVIENKSEHEIQLLTRYWLIKDSLNFNIKVSGEGVVGEMPILKSTQIYEYKSMCALYGFFGTMSGYYTFINLDTQEYFRVQIPMFKMNVSYINN